MKKIAAILLISILLFNICGYRMVLSILQTTADKQLGLSLDNNEYEESQLIEIRIALNMPYQQRYTEFERHYGEIDIDGIAYTYVKRKIDGDILILKCIPNQTKQQVKTIIYESAKSNAAADTDQNNKSKQHHLAKHFWSEYDDQNMFQTINPPATNTVFLFPYSFFIPEVAANIPHQPPKGYPVLS